MKKYLLILSVAVPAIALNAQIPNSGFETWINNNESPHTYLVPQGWLSIDALLSTFNNAFGDPTYVVNSVTQVASAHGGSFAVQMSVVQSNEGDTVAGAIFSEPSANTIISNLFSGFPNIGFPYTTRSANLTGYYKFNRVGNDSASIGLIFTKWNTSTGMRDTIAYQGAYYFTTTVANWTMFSVPIPYLSGANPDTAFVVAGINSQTPHPGTVFTIDDFAFTGTASGIEEQQNTASASLFPNPFSDQATMVFNNVTADHAQLVIYDVLGNEVRVMENISGSQVTISREGLPAGMYFYHLVNDKAVIASGKFSVQ